LKTKWQHIINQGPCPLEDELRLYIDGRLTSDKRFDIENHLAGCEMCSDMLEGLLNVKDPARVDIAEVEIQKKLNEYLFGKQEKKVTLPIYRKVAIAASILIIMGISSLLIYINYSKPMQLEQIAQKTIPDTLKTDTLVIARIEAKKLDKTTQSNKRKQSIDVPQSEATTQTQAITELHDEANITTEQVVQEELLEKESPILKSEDKSKAEPTSYAKRQIKVESNAAGAPAYFGNKMVTGKVVDEAGAGLPGATVLIKGTSKGTVTDIDGNFTLEVPESNSILTIAYVGYTTVEENIEKKDNVNIAMNADVQALNEIIVVGYGTARETNDIGPTKSLAEVIKEDAIERKRMNQLQVDSLKNVLKTNNLNNDATKKLALKYIEIHNEGEAITQLNNLKRFYTDSTQLVIIDEVIVLTKEKKFNKAIKKFNKLP
jgi:hypothetical protein